MFGSYPAFFVTPVHIYTNCTDQWSYFRFSSLQGKSEAVSPLEQDASKSQWFPANLLQCSNTPCRQPPAHIILSTGRWSSSDTDKCKICLQEWSHYERWGYWKALLAHPWVIPKILVKKGVGGLIKTSHSSRTFPTLCGHISQCLVNVLCCFIPCTLFVE